MQLREILSWQILSNPTRVIIRKPSQMRTRRQLLLIGGVMGLLPTIYWLIGMVLTGSSFHPTGWEMGPGFLVIYSVIMQLVVVAVFHLVQWSHVQKVWDLAASAALTGVVACSIAVLELFALDGFKLPRSLVDMFAIIGSVIGSGIVYAIFTLLFWSIAKLHSYHQDVRLFVQEATCCGTCGLDLSGKQPMVCPSCGTAFTLEDLRTQDEVSKLATARGGES